MSETSQERTRYEEVVRNAAWLVHEGVVAFDEVAVPQTFAEAEDQTDVTDEQLREDVKEYMPRVEAADPKTQNHETASVEESSSTVDWEAIWDEFGFGTPDAAGFAGASRTQLELALDCSEQNLTVSVQGAIGGAVEGGELDTVGAVGGDGQPTIRGYRLGGGGGRVD